MVDWKIKERRKNVSLKLINVKPLKAPNCSSASATDVPISLGIAVDAEASNPENLEEEEEGANGMDGMGGVHKKEWKAWTNHDVLFPLNGSTAYQTWKVIGIARTRTLNLISSVRRYLIDFTLKVSPRPNFHKY